MIHYCNFVFVDNKKKLDPGKYFHWIMKIYFAKIKIISFSQIIIIIRSNIDSSSKQERRKDHFLFLTKILETIYK